MRGDQKGFAVFDQVARENVAYVLTRGGRSAAVLISYQEFLRFQALQEQEVLTHIDREGALT